MRMTVEIMADTLIGGVPAKVGDIVDVDSAEGNILRWYATVSTSLSASSCISK